MKKERTVRTWIEIDQRAMAKNIATFRKVIGGKVKLGAVVKSNAYGHNLSLYAKELSKLGVDMLCVDSLVEGITLRKAGIRTKMLVLGYTLPALYKEAGKYDIAIAISSHESLAELRKYKGKTLAVHLKVDTGMHRQGFQIADLAKTVDGIKALPKSAQIVGLFTHFAEAKKPRASARTHAQIREFEEWRETLHSRGYQFLSHAGATGGALVYPQAQYDMVRIGIGAYGIWPSDEVREHRKDITLHPVLTWKTIVSEVKEIQKGESVGYDFTETVKRRTILAVLPIGYWHGFPRALSGSAHVLVRGKRAKVLGRVSMDMIVVDITQIKGVKVGDVVTLIGKDKNEEITADELAKLSSTTAYEMLTRLNPKMERILVV